MSVAGDPQSPLIGQLQAAVARIAELEARLAKLERPAKRELCRDLGDAVIRRRSVLACW